MFGLSSSSSYSLHSNPNPNPNPLPIPGDGDGSDGNDHDGHNNALPIGLYQQLMVYILLTRVLQSTSDISNKSILI